jgi:hypothetical protein
MDFCPSSETISKNNYLDKYTRSRSCIPDSAVINANGSVNTAALNTWVDSLISNTAPAVPVDSRDFGSQGNPASDFSSKAAALRTNISNEYCFYYVRYMWAIQTVLTTATSSSGTVDQAVKDGAQQLNNKLNTILLVMKTLVNSRLNTLNSYYGANGVNKLNSGLDQTRKRLQAHSEKLQKNDMQSDVQAAMIDYSLEKNSSSRNLLAVYGFMNIVAVGLLFYLYKNTSQ